MKSGQVEKIDILIRNGIIVTMNNQMEIFEKGWLALDRGSILAIGSEPEISRSDKGGTDPLLKYAPSQTIDATGRIVFPGLINTHTHVPMSYFKGLADDLPLHIWLNEYIWPRENKLVNPEFVYHASLHGIADLIRNGVTLFNDQYFEGEMTARAAKEAGIRALIGEGIMDNPVANHENARDGIDYSLRLHEKMKSEELVDVTISPHAIYTCGSDTLKLAAETARKNGMLLHTHLSETEKEYDDALKNYRLTPTEYLESLGFWGDDVIAAHAVWLSDKDIDILADRKVSISINTESNLKLASGFLPLKKCLAKQINMTTGTDGVASNNNLSIIEELSITAKVHKALNNDPTFLPAREIVRFPTVNAAKAIGKEKVLGSLEPAKRSDLIIIDPQQVESQPLYDVYSQIVYNLNSANITDVIINGRIVMLNRELLTLDEGELLEKSNFYREKMKS